MKLKIKNIFLFTLLILGFTLLTACKKEKSELEKIADKIEYSDLINENDNKDNIKTDLDLTDIIDGVRIVWTSDNDSVISSKGVVVRPKGKNEAVTLTATLTLEGDTLTRDYKFTVIFIEVGVEFAKFDFKTLEPNTSYVNKETPTVIKNELNNEEFTFNRNRANISKRSDVLQGVVFSIRESTKFQSPSLTSTTALGKLKQVELSIGNWNTDASFNLDDFAESINVEVSNNGTNWNVVKDLKPEWNLTADYLNTFVVDINNDNNEDLYFRIIVNAKTNIESTYQLRLILTSLTFFE